jgi:biotin carboxylase
MGTGFTHMEWYLKSNGEVVFGEIGCRPGGAHLVDQMNYTCDVDLFREWARAVCWRSFEGRTERRYNVAILFKRALGQGRITRVDGLQEFLARSHPWICTEQLLPVGTHRRDWKQTLLSDGFIILRHPDWDRTVQLAFDGAKNVTMIAGG